MNPTTADGSGSSWELVREYALALPGVEEGTSYGTPAFKVKGKGFLRLREDGDSLVVWTDFYERDFVVESDPDTFYFTDHYRDYPLVLVRLSVVGPERLRELVTDSWRRRAPQRLLAEFERGQ
ncbi:MAG TPA: MmcQ/YjbR family DNA-binding protein [Longimicrobiaceae bacterium]|nr:MmcQ/YjbR family DNA-binding protein [Longimicrobiaceae bacterium]